MSRRSAIILAIVAFGLGAAAGGGIGVFVFLQLTGGSSEPSRTADDVVEQLSLDPSQEGAALYRVTEDESEVRFIIEETLLGNPNTVIGETNRVAGDIIVNFIDPVASELGTIAVNARTLRTDVAERNQAIRGHILESSQDEFEFIEFVPTRLIGLRDEPVGIGDTVRFWIEGDLIIRGVARTVVFSASVTIVDSQRLEGIASAIVRYEDFGISIRMPPSVTSVGDEVTLELDFVALRVEA